MNQSDHALSVENISSLIRLIRDQRVILDTDLATPRNQVSRDHAPTPERLMQFAWGYGTAAPMR